MNGIYIVHKLDGGGRATNYQSPIYAEILAAVSSIVICRPNASTKLPSGSFGELASNHKREASLPMR